MFGVINVSLSNVKLYSIVSIVTYLSTYDIGKLFKSITLYDSFPSTNSGISEIVYSNVILPLSG